MKKYLLITMLFVSCGPFHDKETYEQEPDSVGTPGFKPDTTIRKDSSEVDPVPRPDTLKIDSTVVDSVKIKALH